MADGPTCSKREPRACSRDHTAARRSAPSWRLGHAFGRVIRLENARRPATDDGGRRIWYPAPARSRIVSPCARTPYKKIGGGMVSWIRVGGVACKSTGRASRVTGPVSPASRDPARPQTGGQTTLTFSKDTRFDMMESMKRLVIASIPLLFLAAARAQDLADGPGKDTFVKNAAPVTMPPSWSQCTTPRTTGRPPWMT